MDQISDGASIRIIVHRREVLVDRLETGINLLGSKNVETSHEAADQIAERIAGDGGTQTGDGGTQTGSGSRRTAAHARRTLAERCSLELHSVVLKGLMVSRSGRGTLSETGQISVDFASLEHSSWNRGHLFCLAFTNSGGLNLEMSGLERMPLKE